MPDELDVYIGSELGGIFVFQGAEVLLERFSDISHYAYLPQQMNWWILEPVRNFAEKNSTTKTAAKEGR